MVALFAILFVLLPIHGLFMLAAHRDRDMNQRILNDCLALLRRGSMAKRF